MPNAKKEAPTASYEVERLCGYRKTVIHSIRCEVNEQNFPYC